VKYHSGLTKGKLIENEISFPQQNGHSPAQIAFGTKKHLIKRIIVIFIGINKSLTIL
jgi:hypothetical protein